MFTILELGFGFIFIFFGRKLFKINMFIIGLASVVGLFWMLFYTFLLDQNNNQGVDWVIFVVTIIFGGVGGYVLTKFIVVGRYMIVGWGGYVLGLMIY